jgi:hypothetical protein
VVTSHDSFGYFEAPMASFSRRRRVSTEGRASAKDVAAIITQIKKQKAAAVFLENVTIRLVKQIASETGAKIGGSSTRRADRRQRRRDDVYRFDPPQPQAARGCVGRLTLPQLSLLQHFRVHDIDRVAGAVSHDLIEDVGEPDFTFSRVT